MTQLARCGFDTYVFFSSLGGHIRAANMELKFVLARKLRYEGLIGIGIRSAEFVVHMYN